MKYFIKEICHANEKKTATLAIAREVLHPLIKVGNRI